MYSNISITNITINFFDHLVAIITQPLKLCFDFIFLNCFCKQISVSFNITTLIFRFLFLFRHWFSILIQIIVYPTDIIEHATCVLSMLLTWHFQICFEYFLTVSWFFVCERIVSNCFTKVFFKNFALVLFLVLFLLRVPLRFISCFV